MPQLNALRVLLVDDGPDRKHRISLLKANGLTVFPALHLEQARERVRPGRYDLVIVNGRSNPSLALQFCDEIVNQNHEQLLLMMVAPEVQFPRREYLLEERAEALLERVKALFASRAGMAPKPRAA